MLAAPYRLRRGRDITRVYRRGRSGNADILSIKTAPNNLHLSRAVVVVAKKVSKRAVVRNRIRRRAVEYLRQNWQTVTPGYDIVVTVHREISVIEMSELAAAIDKALRRSGTYHQE